MLGTNNYIPKGIFHRGSFSRVISQVATSQICSFPKGNFSSLSQPKLLAPWTVSAAALGPLADPSHRAQPPLQHVAPHLTFGKFMFSIKIFTLVNHYKAYITNNSKHNRNFLFFYFWNSLHNVSASKIQSSKLELLKLIWKLILFSNIVLKYARKLLKKKEKH